MEIWLYEALDFPRPRFYSENFITTETKIGDVCEETERDSRYFINFCDPSYVMEKYYLDVLFYLWIEHFFIRSIYNLFLKKIFLAFVKY